MSLDTSSFIKDARSKSIITHNPIDMDSFNISPIKDKSHKQEKSTICDRSSLNAILADDVKSSKNTHNQIYIIEQFNEVNFHIIKKKIYF
jgi:hypothetical protein